MFRSVGKRDEGIVDLHVIMYDVLYVLIKYGLLYGQDILYEKKVIWFGVRGNKSKRGDILSLFEDT